MTVAKQDLLVFSDDWGRHPSSCQHLIARLAVGRHVWWVNTIGTRPLRFDRYTVQRGVQKVGEWLQRREASGLRDDDQPTILRPFMWPGFGTPWARRLNAAMLSRGLRRAMPHDCRPLVVTTIPLVADIVGKIPAERWVYYCVDDLSQWPGLDREPLMKMERTLLDRVDTVVVVSENLRVRIATLGRTSSLLTHGVDVEHWSNDTPADQAPEEYPALRRPWIVFWGLIDQRLRCDWLARLSKNLGEGTIVLVGPQNNPDPILTRLSNVHRTGPLSYKRLPQIAAKASVLVMPYDDLPATRAMQPLKLKEYLATGKPVVVSRLPAVLDWADCLDVADDAESFVRLVQLRLQTGTPPEQLAARRRLAAESWQAKAAEFERLIRGQEAPR